MSFSDLVNKNTFLREKKVYQVVAWRPNVEKEIFRSYDRKYVQGEFMFSHLNLALYISLSLQ